MTIPNRHAALADIRRERPNTPLLALGQTVFWDEPMKASLRLLLDAYQLGGEMVAGVHDTDYFAKARVASENQARFALMPHNDGTTRDLWSAAGEISTLFGSETFPRRQDYAKAGVAFERAGRTSELGKQGFLDTYTEAWGWRGLVYTGSRDLVVNSLSLREVGDGILELLQWGFQNAISQIASGCCRGEAEQVAETILGWCRAYRAEHPDNTLSELYQSLLPQFYTLLLRDTPQNTTFTRTSDLLRFTPETASLPRFRLVDLFLNPQTRDTATHAYNEALGGSEIYTLDKFGAGATPFDIVLPERGRGTLRVTPRVLFIETRQPIPIALKKPIESVQELAEVLHRKLGDNVTLVGKAVSLISMLAHEYVVAFHEEGSMYVWRTRKMNDILQASGIPMPVHPLLRVRYKTWDALEVGQATLRPAEHLASAFGTNQIVAAEFAANWQQVVAEQRAFCEKSAQLKKPLELLEYLQSREPQGDWEEQKSTYLDAKGRLLTLVDQRNAVQTQLERLYRELKATKAQGLALQTAKGNHFRATEEWTPEATAQRAAFEAEEAQITVQKRRIRAEIEPLKAQRREAERGEKALEARRLLNTIEDASELARLRLVRNALLTVEGLPHTAHRPSAWWLPMIDPTGAWFRRIAETAELYTEPLVS